MYIEEVKLLRSEITWTQNYFGYQADLWDALLAASAAVGDISRTCFAAKEKDMWHQMALDATVEFQQFGM